MECITPVEVGDVDVFLNKNAYKVKLTAGAISIKYPSRKAGGEIRSSQ